MLLNSVADTSYAILYKLLTYRLAVGKRYINNKGACGRLYRLYTGCYILYKRTLRRRQCSGCCYAGYGRQVADGSRIYIATTK